MNKILNAGTMFFVLLGAANAASADDLAVCRLSITPEVRIKSCSKVIEKGGLGGIDLARIYRNRASAYARVRMEEKAIADYSNALRLKPDFAAAYAGRGDVKLSQNNFDRAIADYTAALSANPNYVSAYMARGYAYLAKGETEQAISDYAAAIRVNPDYENAYNSRGVAWRKKGELEKAIQDYTYAIELNPIFALAYANRGYVYESQGRKKEAIEDFRHALYVDPSLASVKNALSRLGESGQIVAEARELASQGEALARKNCARCHAIGKTGKSTNERAPEFRNIHKRHPILDLREPLSRSIAYPHDIMPKFQLSNAEIDRIVAHINSLSLRASDASEVEIKSIR